MPFEFIVYCPTFRNRIIISVCCETFSEFKCIIHLNQFCYSATFIMYLHYYEVQHHKICSMFYYNTCNVGSCVVQTSLVVLFRFQYHKLLLTTALHLIHKYSSCVILLLIPLKVDETRSSVM